MDVMCGLAEDEAEDDHVGGCARSENASESSERVNRGRILRVRNLECGSDGGVEAEAGLGLDETGDEVRNDTEE